MNSSDRLLQIAKTLLAAQDDEDRTAEILLGRVLEATGAERGFLVLRHGTSFEQKLDVRFDGSQITPAEREFSRTLVRQALAGGQPILSPDLSADPRFAGLESVQALGSCSVLCAPLCHEGEAYGAVYLERRGRLEAFDEPARRFLGEFCELAGLFLRRALERAELRERTQSLERDLLARHDFAGILTRDPKLLRLLQTVAQVADAEATILVLGETGTGKELIARALHANSSRRRKPFVAVHATALPGAVLESELFGHVRGAFTGAERDRAGRIASAAGGTLFLDEIAELPPELQAKLLRFLQFGEIQRLGSDRTETVDVRVVCATHQDVGALVRDGRFRQDLYFRLNVVELKLPPLRERPGDVLLLAEHFLRQRWKRPGPPPRWSAQARRLLEAYGWPGNVRELENLVERACLLASGPELDADLLPEALKASAPSLAPELAFQRYTNEELKSAVERATAELERRFVEGLLRQAEGNVSRAARDSGLSRSHLQRLLARHRDSLQE